MALITHPFISNTCNFNGKTECRVAPPIMNMFEVLDHANAYETWKLNGGREDDHPCARIRVKHKNTFFDLPY
jgi:hypothetical protein